MITDQPPRRKDTLSEFCKSDRLKNVDLPKDDRLNAAARGIEMAMRSEDRSIIRKACVKFLAAIADFYGVPKPAVRVLASRPFLVRESVRIVAIGELFGDYDPAKNLIRVWMRTAIRRQVTTFGTFLNTLCHEFCHHLDYERFGFRHSYHTRGFYERVAVFYHHARGMPAKRLVWLSTLNGCWRIDWSRINRSAKI